MSEDDGDDDDEGDDLDDDGNDTGFSSTRVAGVPLAAAQAVAGQAKAAAHKFLPPLEVELQMQHLWKHEAGVLDLIFASGKKSNGRSPPSAGNGSGKSPGGSADGVSGGFRVFFIRALAVPPPRFRPPMHMGDMIAEHPQNVYLTKVRGVGVSCNYLHRALDSTAVIRRRA